MNQRIELLDFWRSLCLFIMVAFHLCYDLALLGVIPMDVMTSLPARLIAYDVGGCFIFISGICLRFSREPVRRGFFVFCAGALVTVVTALLRMPVAFGILQCIGVCMMLCGALREKIEPRLGVPFALINLALFLGTWFLTANVTVYIKLLYPLGMHAPEFFSADYWPLLPWAFLYLIGMYFGKLIEQNRANPLFSVQFPQWTTFPGRHSLIIYLLHQPVLYGACLLFFGEL